MRTAVLVLAIMGVTGCSTSAIKPENASPVPQSSIFGFQHQSSEQDAKITFTRDSGFSGAACDYLLGINGEDIASVGVGETVTFYYQPGAAILSASTGICSGSLQEISVDLKSKTAYQFRGFRNASGDPGISPTGRPPHPY